MVYRSFFFFVSILQIYKVPQFNNTKIKSSKIQVQNKTQTLRKSYTFLNKVCTRRGYMNINNNNNDNNDNKIRRKYIYKIKLEERKEREREKKNKKKYRHIFEA